MKSREKASYMLNTCSFYYFYFFFSLFIIYLSNLENIEYLPLSRRKDYRKYNNLPVLT